MKYSMMSYTMARQPGFDLKAMLELTKELKLDGIDFVTLHGKSPEELRKMADGYGIPVVCHTFMADLNFNSPEERKGAVETCKRGFEAAVILGAPVVMIPTPPKEGLDSRASRRNWIDGLKELAPFAKDAGLTLTVENFPGKESPFVVAGDFLEAQREIPSLRLTYDNGNAGTGEDPAESFRRCAKYVAHAHFKDWTVGTEGREMRDGRLYTPALIGEGVIDQKACLKAMRECGYSGCINIEYEGSLYKAGDATRKAVEYLRSAE